MSEKIDIYLYLYTNPYLEADNKNKIKIYHM